MKHTYKKGNIFNILSYSDFIHAAIKEEIKKKTMHI